MIILWNKLKGNGGSGGGGGSTATITLLSITTAPTGTFEKGSKYYNSTTRLIYTATADDVWGTDGETPKFNTIYIYDNNGTTEYYQWDGDNLVETDLEKYQLKSNITNSFDSSSQVTYPSSKALKEGLETAKPNLFDIKTLSQAIADKGWACLSHTTRKDIAKASVPTLYNDILEKYNNVEKGELPWTEGVSYNGDIDYHNGYLYYANGEYNQIFRTNDPISTNFTLFAQLNSGTRTNTFRCFTNYMLVVGWNDIRVISYENGSYIAIPYSNSQDADITFKEIGDYIYVIASEHNKIMRIPNIPYSQITTSSMTDVIDCSQFNAGQIADILFSPTNSMWYLTTYSGGYAYVHKTIDLSNINDYNLNIYHTTTWLDSDGWGRLFQKDNRIVILIYHKRTYGLFVVYTDDYFVTVNTTDMNSGLGTGFFTYKDGFIYASGQTSHRSGGNTYTNPELDIIDIHNLTSTTNMFGYAGLNRWAGGATRLVFCNDALFYMGYKDVNTNQVTIHYSGIAPVTYTDTYQINGSFVAINYYKYNDWKICLPNITNDTNLDTVYEYLGYHNYWRINTTSGSETISLPRNSNLWTMMYVGDDYQDSSLPTGSFSNAPKKIIGTSAPTTTTVGSVGDIFVDVTNVKIYICTNVYWDSTINNNEGAYVYVWTLQNETDINNLLPSQTGNSGKALTTNGNTVSWGNFVPAPTVLTDQSSTSMALAGNTIYKWTSALTSLRFASVEVSDLETVLYFTTGGTISFTDSSNLKWGGDGFAPSLEANTVYCISIRNGLAEIDTFGTVS